MIFLRNDNLNTSSGYVQKNVPGKMVGPLLTVVPDLPYVRQDCLAGEFYGVNTFLEYLKEEMPFPKFQKSSDQPKENDFNYFKDYATAMETYLNNPQSIRKFDEKDEQLEGGDAAGKQVQFDVTGDFLDIGRFVEGDPEVFGSMTEGNPRARRVQIILNISWVCIVPEHVINTRCSRLARLVDWLESQQVRCRVVAVESTSCSHLELVVKDFDDALDLNDVAVVSHSDFLRRAVFRFKEWSETITFGYGSPVDLSRAINSAALVPEYNSEFTIFIDSQVTRPEPINAQFDTLETWLEQNIANDSLTPEERVRTILR